jgi:glycosyltransferase involved in cell wall biosynthesis
VVLILKVTVITVCWNSQKTIEDTLKSVLNQSYQNIEYLIIDGQSKDKTLDIIRNYEKVFNSRMKWISEPDKGIYDAMNKGINMATGSLIGILNSDDWYAEDAVKLAVEAYKNAGYDRCIVSGNMNLTKFNKEVIRINVNKKVKENINSCMPINHPATFVPKLIYEEIGIFDVNFKLSADYEFIYRAFVKGVNFVFIDAILANMRLGGATNGAGAAGLKNSFVAAKEDYHLKLKHSGKKFTMLYYKQVLILKLRQLKRLFIPSKYE